MAEFGEWLFMIGEKLTALGLILTPLSFVAYLILSCLQYKWGSIHYTKAAKVFWYLAVGIGEITGDERFYLLVVLMIFMDCTDSLFEFLEEKRDLR